MNERLWDAIKATRDAALQCIKDKNWIGALTIALALPDQCAFSEGGSKKSEASYVAWFDKWLASSFQEHIGFMNAIHVVFLSGQDMYALRCAFLHRASSEIADQRAQDFLESIQFVVPDDNGESLHLYRTKTELFLQVDLFVQDICGGVDQWLQSVEGTTDQSIIDRAARLAALAPRSAYSLRGERNLTIESFDNEADALRHGITVSPQMKDLIFGSK
jgi:hypothetical protein